MKILNIIMVGSLLTLAACSAKKEDKGDDQHVKTELQTVDNAVTVMNLQPRDFNYELISNGKITASRYADLVFSSSGIVSRVYVKDGDHVGKGQAVAQLNLFMLRHSLAESRTSLEQAKLELQDFLIGQGYSADKLASVPKEVMRLARIKSGYDRSLSDLEITRYNIANATLRAPFAGVIANVKSKANNMTSADPVCRVISTCGMEVQFSVLENELRVISKGEDVEIRGFADGAHMVKGHVTEINPIVDDNGLVSVKARIDNGASFISGMNVRVSVEKRMPHQLVIPKTAVVQRSGRQVVFTLEDGQAYWNYVQTGVENMNEYTVTDGLQAGAKVIVTGNRNLSHGSPVQVIKDRK
jgi:membrane fusion protein (multidrug efflux system)